jgi:hypothetical protein
MNELSDWEGKIIESGRKLAETLVNSAMELEIAVEDHEGAYARTVARRAPARQGSKSTHDCLIAERSMRAARIRVGGSTVLLTSNINDFGSPGERPRSRPRERFCSSGT